VKSTLPPDLLIDQHITPTFVLNSHGEVVVWNQACEALTGVKAAEVLGTKSHWRGFYAQARPCLADLVLSDQIEAVSEYYDLVADLRGRKDAIAAEDWLLMPNDGRRLYLAVEAAALRDGQGELVGVIETLRDLTAMKTAEVRFRSLAGVDGLTGIANRRTFEEALTMEWRRAVRSGASLSMLLVDIDHFKQFNDKFGHQRGDACLREVAGVLAAKTHRAGDFPARFGGEEFAIVLPATESAGAAHIAEIVRAGVERLGLPHPFSSVGSVVTVSIGVASITPTVDDRAQKLVCFADTALYRAKESGRNRTCLFDESPRCAAIQAQPGDRDTATVALNSCEQCQTDGSRLRMQ